MHHYLTLDGKAIVSSYALDTGWDKTADTWMDIKNYSDELMRRVESDAYSEEEVNLFINEIHELNSIGDMSWAKYRVKTGETGIEDWVSNKYDEVAKILGLMHSNEICRV